MGWVVTVAFFVFLFWRVRRARERIAEMSPTGLLRSPLYWSANMLVLLLLGLVLYIARIHHHAPVPAALWAAVLAIIAALLILRRALRWRYPV